MRRQNLHTAASRKPLEHYQTLCISAVLLKHGTLSVTLSLSTIFSLSYPLQKTQRYGRTEARKKISPYPHSWLIFHVEEDTWPWRCQHPLTYCLTTGICFKGLTGRKSPPVSAWLAPHCRHGLLDLQSSSSAHPFIHPDMSYPLPMQPPHPQSRNPQKGFVTECSQRFLCISVSLWLLLPVRPLSAPYSLRGPL